MKKRNLIFGFSALAIALCLGALGVNNTTSVAKADDGVAETVYGSWADNEEVASQVNGDLAWYKTKTDITFDVNGITWTSNFGRARVYGEGRSYYQLIASTAGEENSILSFDEIDEPYLYGLSQYLLNLGTVGYGNQLSAIYSEPVLVTEDINVYYKPSDRGWFYALFYTDEDIYYDPDENGTLDSVLYEANTWNFLTINGENAAINQGDEENPDKAYAQGSKEKGSWNEGALHINSKGNWKFSYIKGHEIRIALAYYHWTVAQGEDAAEIGIYDVVVNSTKATTAYMTDLANRAPNEERPFLDTCALIKTTDNYFGNTLRSVQAELTDEAIATLNETALEGEHTSYTTVLGLLNYLNEQAGIDTYNSRLSLLVSNNPTTIVVFSAITVLVVALSALAIYKKRKTHKA